MGQAQRRKPVDDLRQRDATLRCAAVCDDSWLIPERFDYVALGERLAVVRLRGRLGEQLLAPDGASLAIRAPGGGTSHPAGACRTERHSPCSELTWRAAFAVPLELLEMPRAVFELRAAGRASIRLPELLLGTLGSPVVVGRFHPRRLPSYVPRRLTAVMTTVAVAGGSLPASGIAASSPTASTVRIAAPLGLAAAQIPVRASVPQTPPRVSARQTPPRASALVIERLASEAGRPRYRQPEAIPGRAVAPRPPGERVASTGRRDVSASFSGPRGAASHSPRPAERPGGRRTAERPRSTGSGHRRAEVSLRIGQISDGAAVLTGLHTLTLAPPASVPASRPVPTREPPTEPVPQPAAASVAPGQGTASSGSPSPAGSARGAAEAAAFSHLSGVPAVGSQPPSFLVPLYQGAGRRYQIPWRVLAAINEIETNYGRNLSVSTAGAVGWMQFMPATWQQYGVSVDGHSAPDPFNPADAIYSAARYLAANGGATDIRGALFAYNHATWYVDQVLAMAGTIGVGAAISRDARPRIDAMIKMADALVGRPYVWGGGHGGWGIVAGYDCSGFVSAVLHAGGYLSAPQSTETLPSQPDIVRGPGRYVTIFDRAGAGGQSHMIMELNGTFYESGGSGAGAGSHKMAAPSPAYLASFNLLLHPAGL